MKIKISMDDTKISGTSSVLSNSLIMGGENDDVRIKLHNLDVGEQARLLENLEISSVLEELSKRVEGMDKDADEYCEIQEILKVRQWNREGFTRCITKHLGEFSQGVLASVVANFITGFIVQEGLYDTIGSYRVFQDIMAVMRRLSVEPFTVAAVCRFDSCPSQSILFLGYRGVEVWRTGNRNYVMITW